MDRVFRRSARLNQSKTDETKINEHLTNKRKQPTCNMENDVNESNPGIKSTAKRIVSNIIMKHKNQTPTTTIGQQSTSSSSILTDLTNISGTTFVNSSRSQFTSSVDKENSFQRSTYKHGECSRTISTPASKTPSLRLGVEAPTNSDQRESTSNSLSKDARSKRKNMNKHRRQNITPIAFDLEQPISNDVQKTSFKGISKEYDDYGDRTYICSACGAKLWLKETKRGKQSEGLSGAQSLCCQKGKIALPQFTKSPPKLIWDLYTNNHPKSKHFLENVRQYNMIFAFTSMGGKVDNRFNKKRGPYTFRISGQNFHQYGGLLPTVGHKPRFGQLYIYDTENEASNRKQAISGKNNTKSTSTRNSLDEDLIAEIMQVLDEHNPLVKTWRMARERFTADPDMQLKIRLIGRRTKDGRNYNLPTVDEVAALIVGDINVSSFDERDIIIDSHVEGLKRISELHTEYLALQYPLLFIYAEDGYRTDILHRDVDVYENTTRKKKRVSMREFFAYKLQERAEPTLVHLGRKLYQQFVVDAYTMVEAERISYIRKNQRILRADTFTNLMNVSLSGDTVNSMMGNMIKLPSSFTGSARYMIENYRDAMALCRVFGYPDIFLTFTCNPKWPEIERELEGTGLKAEDNPALSARVFKMKLDQLMKDIRKKKMFGTLKAEVYTVEFQKRGLPHAHICIFLDERSKMPQPEDVDKYICAELPDEDSDPELYQLVSELMIHGPCGNKDPSCPCTDSETKICTKRFPKPFSDVTKTDEDGYPIYRRRNDGRSVRKKGHDLDNSCVVAYNPQLLKMYQAHINVEWCNQVGSIRYLFKYINKGNDKITAQLCDQETDEIKEYYDCRYVSSCEAIWRIFAFDIHHHSPSVIRLPFHLEGEHQVIFDEDEIIEDVIEKPSVNTSMFLEWMKCNIVNEEARQLTYVDFPTKFIWDRNSRVWKPRKNKTGAIGRIHHVAPASGDLFYLRILLNKVKGPTSYEEIRTVNGNLFDNFKDACFHLGLLDDDKEYIEAIEEAFFMEGGHFVRTLFTQLLLSNSMSRPEDVFDKTFEFLSVDVVHPNRPDIGSELLKDLTLQEIEKLLQRNSSSLRSFSSMPFPSNTTRNVSENHLIIDELSYDRSTLEVEHSDFITKLTTEQKDAYDQIIKAVGEDKGDVFFLYGYGGTGKTFLWKTLTAAVRSKGDIVLNVASSGIAALLLSGGRTAHSRFRIPLQPTDESFCSIKPNSNLAELIRRAKLIIWDEAPMVNRMCFEAMDRSMRDICRQVNPDSMHTPFGGKIIVFGGDFRQILPVIQKGSRQDIVAASLSSSYLWNYVTVLKLTVNMRLRGLSTTSFDADTRKFAEWILDIGNGNVGESQDGDVDIQIPEDLLITDSVDPIGSMISTIYPDYLLNLSNPEYYQQRAILAPTHEVVDVINDRMMHCLEGEERSYLSSDSICASQRDSDFNSELYTTDYLNSIEVGGLPKHNLRLKVGVPVMLLRNVDQAGGMCNGTRLQVLELGQRIIKAKILTGSNVGKITAISRMLIVPTDKRIPFRLQRRQFPLSVCFTMTINKSQGQSLEHVGLFLPRPVFSHGQLYVALSRVTNRQGIKILIQDNDNKISNTTKNVVFKEVLQHLES